MNPTIEALSHELEGIRFPITVMDLTIGRDPSNDILLVDHTASVHHCSIRLRDGRALLMDLGSKNGTFVNGFHFPSKILVHGDRITVSSYRFVYYDCDEVDAELATLIKAFKDEEVRTTRSEARDKAKTAILDAFLQLSASISTIRSADEIQARVLDLIFRIMGVERVAILLAGHDQSRFVSVKYRRIDCQPEEPFPIDEDQALTALRDGKVTEDEEHWTVCRPMTTLDAKVGVIYVVFPMFYRSWFSTDQRGILESIAGFAALALEHARYVAWLEGENRRLNEAVQAEHGMIGQSEKMKEVSAFIGKAGPSDRTVMISGASGTGKELAARAIHRHSPRSGKAFVAVNCGAFTETLLESELFGHEKGTFTGAVSQRKGLFELADGGTLFLDEIGELPIAMQPALLRVLQDGEFKRLGGSHSVRVNVRVIAATNRNLKQAIQEGRFREDLFFRLNVLELEMPPLCERREDIPRLAAHFITKFAHIRTAAAMPSVLGITPEAHHLLATYAWPGNIRELEHAIEHAISLGVTQYIRPGDLPKSVRAPTVDSGEMESYDAEIDAFRKALFERTLRKTNGNYRQAAERLGLNVKYFYRVCRELSVKWS